MYACDLQYIFVVTSTWYGTRVQVEVGYIYLMYISPYICRNTLHKNDINIVGYFSLKRQAI